MIDYDDGPDGGGGGDDGTVVTMTMRKRTVVSLV